MCPERRGLLYFVIETRHASAWQRTWSASRSETDRVGVVVRFRSTLTQGFAEVLLSETDAFYGSRGPPILPRVFVTVQKSARPSRAPASLPPHTYQFICFYLYNSHVKHVHQLTSFLSQGIVFCLIILQIRFHLGWSSIHHNDPTNQNTNSLSFSHHLSANPGAVSSRRGGRGGGGRGGRSGLGTETLDGGATSIPMHIRITQERDVEVAYPDVQGAARVRRLGGGGAGVTGAGEGNAVEEQYEVGSEDDLEKKVSI